MTEVRLRPYVTLADLEKRLRDQANESNTTVVKRYAYAKDAAEAYLGWVNGAWRMLESHLEAAQLEELLHTPHYWSLRQMDGGEAWLHGQVKVELNDRREALTAMADEAKNLAMRWDVPGSIVMPDTNMLIHTNEFFDEFDWPEELGIGETVHLVIPMVVVDQLDSLKRSTQKVKSRARQTGKRLEALLPKPADRVVMRAADGRETTLEVLIDALDHRRLPDSDSEIVNRALYLSRLAGKPVRIATWDNLMRFRAGAVDIETIRPPEAAEIQS
jgi:hypothetical protein